VCRDEHTRRKEGLLFCLDSGGRVSGRSGVWVRDVPHALLLRLQTIAAIPHKEPGGNGIRVLFRPAEKAVKHLDFRVKPFSISNRRTPHNL
jgi:hypothetical protein